jgi:hypothetical protein
MATLASTCTSKLGQWYSHCVVLITRMVLGTVEHPCRFVFVKYILSNCSYWITKLKLSEKMKKI